MNSYTSFHFGFFSVILVSCVVTGTGVVIDCYTTTVDEYIGHQQTTKNGTPCIRWDSYDKKVYRNEQFRDVTVSDAANYCRAVGKDYLWCWTSNSSDWETCGIKKCDNNDIYKCGNLKIEQPALLGRNVTFTFTPDSHDPDAILEWQRADRAQGNPWYTRPLTYKFTQYNENGIYYMVLTDSVLKDDEVHYRIHYYNETVHCWMEAGKLELDDNPNNPCGFVYLRNDRVLEGENVYLEYYPSKDVMENPDNFRRDWWVRSKNGSTLYIKIEDDTYIEDDIENGKYTLTFSIDNSMNGNYGVYCGSEVEFTNNISVVGLDTDIIGINKCGNLKIEQPALLGRNVTFTFTPDSQDPDAILEWQRAAKRNPWYTRPLTYKFTQYNENGIYYMVLTDSLLKHDEVHYRIHYYNESMHCWMEAGKLELDDSPNNPCGFLYLRNERVLEDENIYLEYYPSKDVMENPNNFRRQLWVRSKDRSASNINIEDDIYIENKKENGIYTFTLSMAKSSMNGRYGVYCGRETGFTNNVLVVVQVPPSAPEFVGLQDIDTCKKCIVGSDKENIKVHCKTIGGTPPVNVNVAVEDELFKALQSDDDTSIYIAFITLADRYHNATITCSVKYGVLISSLFTTAKLYVIKPPTNVLLVASSNLKEGNPVHILCLSQSSRPSLMVYLNISGLIVSSGVDTSTTFNQVTSLYSNFITFTTFKREWHGKNIVCCSYNKWYNAPSYCSRAKQVNFVFPPSDIKLEIKFDSVDPLHMYAVCTLNNSNPACTANFLAASISIGSERNSIKMSLPHGAWKTEYVVNLNVSKEDNGKDVTCAAECAEFQDLDLRDTKKIKLPWNKRQMPELSDKGNGTLIGIIVGICLALVVIVVVIAVVIRKTRTNNQDQPSQERNSLQQRNRSRQQSQIDSQNANIHIYNNTRTDNEAVTRDQDHDASNYESLSDQRDADKVYSDLRSTEL